MKNFLLSLVVLAFSLPAFAAHNVTVTWKAPVTGPQPDHYKVYRSTVSGSGYVLLGQVPANQLGFVNGSNPDGSALVEGTTYFYVATSVSGTQESVHSNEVSATIPVSTQTVQPPAVNKPAVQ